MNTIEFFSGDESFSEEARKRSYKTFTIDINDGERHKPDLKIDILELNTAILSEKYDILWFSPPCEAFSVSSIGKHWTGGYRAYIPKSLKAENSLKLINKCLNIINDLKPKYWYIENPRGVLRKIIPHLFDEKKIEYTRKTVSYCQYGDFRMKPTDIFTNNRQWIPKKICKNGDNCHIRAPRGSRTGTQGGLGSYLQRSAIPKDLINEILDNSK